LPPAHKNCGVWAEWNLGHRTIYIRICQFESKVYVVEWLVNIPEFCITPFCEYVSSIPTRSQSLNHYIECNDVTMIRTMLTTLQDSSMKLSDSRKKVDSPFKIQTDILTFLCIKQYSSIYISMDQHFKSLKRKNERKLKTKCESLSHSTTEFFTCWILSRIKIEWNVDSANKTHLFNLYVCEAHIVQNFTFVLIFWGKINQISTGNHKDASCRSCSKTIKYFKLLGYIK
jgi:hypothetical protein